MAISRTNAAFRLWLLCMVTSAFFCVQGSPNAVTRMALSIGMVERHELTLGRMADLTTDKAQVGHAYYSDKAPGLSFLAMPITYLGAWAFDPSGDGRAWFRADGQLSKVFWLLCSVATLSTVSLLASLAVVGIYRWSLWRGATEQAALTGALLLGFATPACGWATVFFGHAASGALTFVGFVLLVTAMESDDTARPSPAWFALLAGVAFGIGFTIDFPAGPAIGISGIACAIAAACRPDRWRLLRRVFMPAGLVMLLTLLPLLVYNAAAFGAPFRLGYENVQGFSGMKTGFFGISFPNVNVMTELLFGGYRGLLPLSPVLVLFPLAAAVALRDPAWRLAGFVAISVFVYYLCLNSGYYYWDGGYSTGPRHMVAALPFLAVVFVPFWDRAGTAMRALICLLLAISFAMSMLSVSIDMQASNDLTHAPITDILLPKFLSGGFDRALTTRMLGIKGVLALVPLVLAWSIIASPLRPMLLGIQPWRPKPVANHPDTGPSGHVRQP